jgi:hydroxypyruvate isomerase
MKRGLTAGTHLPVAANLHFLFTEVPFLERFAAAARAGFQAVEFPDPYSHPTEQLAGLLAEHGLTCALLNFPMGDRARGELGYASHPDRKQEFRAGVPLAIETARALGCRQLNCMAGFAPPGADPAELRATLVENLRLAARAGAEHGVRLLLEPLNTHDRPGLFVTGSAQAMAIIDEVGAENLRLQFDCYHLARMGEDLPPVLAALLPRVGHVQVADVPGRVQPGGGEIPYAKIFGLLEAGRYLGWIGAEYHPSGRTEDSLGWLRP